MPLRPTLFAFALALIGGCATAPVNPQNVSTFDLLFRYGDLQRYLQTRRNYLEQLDSELSRLDINLGVALGELSGARQELAAAQSDLSDVTSEIRRLESENRDLLAEAERALSATLAAERNLKELQEKSLAPGEIGSDREELAEAQRHLEALQTEVANLEVRVRRGQEQRRNLILRAESGLRSD